MDQQNFLWKGSLLPLLLLTTLLLCSNVTSHPLCPSGADNCPKTLQYFFDGAVSRSHSIHVFATELFTKLNKLVSTAPWYFTDSIITCHTASVNAPESWEEAKKLPTSELFSLSRLILRSWVDPLTYLMGRSSGTTFSDTLTQLQLQSEQLLADLDGIADQVDPSNKQKKDFVPWLKLLAMLLTTAKPNDRAAYYVARCMIKDSEKIYNSMGILQCRYSFEEYCKPLSTP